VRMSIKVVCTVISSLISIFSLFGAQVDQENWAPEQVVSSFVDSQQEFRPTLNSLDSVQLWIPRGNQLPLPSPFSGSSAVNIRQGGINGPIIAASQPTYVPPPYSGPGWFGAAEAGLVGA